MDIGAYRAPSLRNIDLTGPYMHDGRFKTLDDVLNFYSTGVVASPYISPLMHHVGTGGVQLNPSQKVMLKAFLMTLHDDEFITNPDFSKPAKFPDGTTQ
jgi:cytochrome c peroxidase